MVRAGTLGSQDQARLLEHLLEGVKTGHLLEGVKIGSRLCQAALKHPPECARSETEKRSSR